MNFLLALRAAARHCKFEELKDHADPHEEMIKLKLISGLKLLEYLQNKPAASVPDIANFIQNLEQTQKFVESEVLNRLWRQIN